MARPSCPGLRLLLLGGLCLAGLAQAAPATVPVVASSVLPFPLGLGYDDARPATDLFADLLSVFG